MSSRRLLGERVMVKVNGCQSRDGVLISGVKKPTELIQSFPIRFPNGDVRTYRGDQLLLRGSHAPLVEYIRVGDIIFTKETLGVVRFIGLHEEFDGTVIVLEPIDPKLPTDPNVKSFHRMFPSANLSDRHAYIIVRGVEEILKILPPDTLLQQLSKIKDKYLATVEEAREKDRVFEEDMNNQTKIMTDLENEIKELRNEVELTDTGTDFGAVPLENSDDVQHTQILFQPGMLGIKAIWGTGVIEGTLEGGQAEKFGVKAGWTIIKIDDVDYSEDLIDSKAAGEEEYMLTFKTPMETPGNEPRQTETGLIVPTEILNLEVPIKEFLTVESEREKYESKINYLNEQIDDFQYTVESLQEKNEKLEEDHKEMPNLSSKVEKLRHSRTMFMRQIKEMQKQGKEWMQKAEEKEKKYNKLVQELQSGETSRKGKKDAAKHRRKGSVQMPTPDSANTVSLGGKPTAPQIGDGSSQSFSLSNLYKNDGAGNHSDRNNSKNIKSKKLPRKLWSFN